MATQMSDNKPGGSGANVNGPGGGGGGGGPKRRPARANGTVMNLEATQHEANHHQQHRFDVANHSG